MADAKATFAIGLDTAGLVRPGDEAAQVLERLKEKIQAETAQLALLNKAMRNLKGGSSVNVQAFRELQARIDKSRQSAASAQADFLNLGGKLGDVAKKAKAFKPPPIQDLTSLAKPAQNAFQEMAETIGGAAGAMGGPLGRAAEGASGLLSKLGSMRLLALAGAAALVALAVAAAYAAVKLISFGIAAANSARSELLHLKGLTTIRNWFGIAAGSAEDLQKAISQVSASSDLGRDKIAGYAEELYKGGLRGDALADALDATAIKASVQGDEWASMFMGVATGANRAGVSVKGLADRVRTNLGDIAKAKALDLNVQIAKMHENFAELFAGVKIDPLLRGLHQVTELFSQNTITGRALKQMMEDLLNPLAKAVEKVGPIVKRFFQGLVIGALDVEIAILRLQLWMKKTFGDVKLFKGLDLMNAALMLGKLTVWTLLAGFMLVAGVVGGMVATVKPFFDLFLLFYDLLSNYDWGKAGKAFVDGLDKALAAGKSVLEMRTSELVDAIKKKFHSLFEVGSPSRWAFRVGGFVTEGLAGGVEAGLPEVHRSLGSMIAAPSEAASGVPARAGGAAAAQGGATVRIQELHYHASGGREKHAGDAEDFRSQLVKTLEGVGILMGAPA